MRGDSKGVAPWVKHMTEEAFGKSAMAVGKTLQHPDGRTVRITDGALWTNGGFSNFWTWHEVRADGSLGPEERGYGW